MKELKFVLIIVFIYIISVGLAYFLGSKFGSTEKIIYNDVPVFKTDTLIITKEKITNATVGKENPPIISDSLNLDDIFKNMYVRYIAKPYYRDSILCYMTEWKHNISVVKELYIDTIKIEKYKKDFGFSCLIGSVGFIGGSLLTIGGILYILLR